MGVLDMNAIKQARDRLENGSGNNIGFAKLNQGRNVVRVLWPKGDKSMFYAEGLVHYGVGPEGKNMATCLKTFGGGNRCPICEYADQLQRSKNKDDQNAGSRIRARKRIYINVLNRDEEGEGADDPKVLPIGVTILRPLLDVICDPDYGDITHPETGRDITITKKGQGLKTEYSVVVKPKETPASEKWSPEELEEKMADLESLFREQSVSDLEALISSDGDEDESSEMDGGSAKSSGDGSEYDDLELDELRSLCQEREIPVPDKASKFKLIMYLTQYDEEQQKEDEVMGAIGDAINSRKK